MNRTISQQEIEESGILSAVWILASNDENPYMLYGSAKFRLGLSEDYDLKGLIKKHQELFRLKCPQFRLDEWKQDMLSGKRTTVWLKDIEIKERKKKIESLTTEDVFRSQFRAKVNADRSDINLINWGLEHIERLRKVKVESQESKLKKWKELWIPLVSILASIIISTGTIIITSYWQGQNIVTQKQIKELELTYKPKLEGYLSFLQLVDEGFDLATKRNLTSKSVTGNSFELSDHFRKIDSSFYTLEPFLRNEKKQSVERKLADYKNFLTEVYTSKENTLLSENVGKSIEFSNFFRNELSKELFEPSSTEK